MRRRALAAGGGLWLATLGRIGRNPALGMEPVVYPAPGIETGRLVVASATDRAFMEPLLRDFQATQQGITIVYHEGGSNEIHDGVINPGAAHPADLVISSAVDLQIKLVNDGLTRPHVSASVQALPGWANWRDEAFGFTLEPIVVAYHRDLLPEAAHLRTRLDLIRLIQADPERFRGRIATYDIEASGTGYIFAAQDEVLSTQFWRLVTTLGGAGPRLYPTTSEMLDAVARGEVLLAYNVIGPYARARQAAGDPIAVVQLRDYTLALSRVAVIPRAAARPDLAGLLIDHLLSPRGQKVIDGLLGPGVIGPAEAAVEDDAAALQPIELGPALLVFADPLRKARFLADWRLAMTPP